MADTNHRRCTSTFCSNSSRFYAAKSTSQRSLTSSLEATSQSMRVWRSVKRKGQMRQVPCFTRGTRTITKQLNCTVKCLWTLARTLCTRSSMMHSKTWNDQMSTSRSLMTSFIKWSRSVTSRVAELLSRSKKTCGSMLWKGSSRSRSKSSIWLQMRTLTRISMLVMRKRTSIGSSVFVIKRSSDAWVSMSTCIGLCLFLKSRAITWSSKSSKRHSRKKFARRATLKKFWEQRNHC